MASADPRPGRTRPWAGPSEPRLPSTPPLPAAPLQEPPAVTGAAYRATGGVAAPEPARVVQPARAGGRPGRAQRDARPLVPAPHVQPPAARQRDRAADRAAVALHQPPHLAQVVGPAARERAAVGRQQEVAHRGQELVRAGAEGAAGAVHAQVVVEAVLREALHRARVRDARHRRAAAAPAATAEALVRFIVARADRDAPRDPLAAQRVAAGGPPDTGPGKF